MILNDQEKLLLSDIVYKNISGRFVLEEYIVKAGFSAALQELLKKGIIHTKNYSSSGKSYVFANSKEEVFDTFREEELIERKKKILLKYLKFFRLSPFIRAVFMSGSLVSGRVDDDSDLDVFVLISEGRIWTARFFLSAILSLFGIRRTKFEPVAPNKVCLSHYMIVNSVFHYESIFTAQVLGSLELLWEAESGVGKSFVRRHKWLRKHVLSFNESLDKPVGEGQTFLQKVEEWFLNGRLGVLVEWVLKSIQLGRIKNDLKAKNPNGRIVATDKMLEFHPDSKESEVIRDYNLTMKKLGFPEFGNEKSSKMEVILD